MVEKRGIGTIISHVVLIAGIAVMCFPIYLAFVAASVSHREIIRPPMPLVPGPHLVDNFVTAITEGTNVGAATMMFNSLVMAMGIAIGKIAISIISAYAIVYFRFPFRMLAFWAIFMTLMLPVEVRIVPTYEVVASLKMLNSYTGLILPLIASATATFLFRQFFMTIPDELVEAARVDGAGPLRFFKDILLPLSVTNIAALFVILFIYGWTQYLWPLLMTNRNDMTTIVIGLKKMISFADADTQWHLVMVTAMLAIIPPILVVLFMQRWFVRGLIETEK